MLTVSPLQIKNMVAAACALAVYQNTKVSMSHLELVTNLRILYLISAQIPTNSLTSNNAPTAYSYVLQAVEASENFIREFNGRSIVELYTIELMTEKRKFFMRFVLLALDFWRGPRRDRRFDIIINGIIV